VLLEQGSGFVMIEIPEPQRPGFDAERTVAGYYGFLAAQLNAIVLFPLSTTAWLQRL
jgi:hypothetical protein